MPPDSLIIKNNPDANDSNLPKGVEAHAAKQKCLNEVAEVVGNVAAGAIPGLDRASLTGAGGTDSHQALRSSALPEKAQNEIDHALAVGISRAGNSDSSRSESWKFSNYRENPDGTVTRTRDDGAECTFSKIMHKDGGLSERLETTVRDGKTRTFKYENAGDPFLVTSFTDQIKAAYGKGEILEDKFVRINQTNEFIATQADGRTFRMEDVQIGPDGRVTYFKTPEDALDRDLERIFGRERLNSGDLISARQRLIDAGGNLFGGHMAEHIDRIINRLKHNGEHGVKQPTDDEIAKLLDYIRAPLETTPQSRHNAGARLTQGKVMALTEEYIQIMENPEDRNRQAQIGSCYLQAGHFAPEKRGDWRLAKAHAEAIIDGTALGKYKLTDLAYQSVNGQSPENHLLNSIYARVFGYGDVTGYYPGTYTPQIQQVSRALFGESLPMFVLGTPIKKSALDAAIARNGAVACLVGIRRPQDHAQAITKNDQGQYVLVNWWYRGDDRVISARELNLIG